MLFDFDGTLWDCEPVIFEAYRQTLAAAGYRLSERSWLTVMGKVGSELWDQFERAVPGPVDWRRIEAEARRRITALLSTRGPRPGARSWLDDADALGIVRGIVSNSPRSWVIRYAEQCGLGEGWRVVQCADGDRARAKPDPALYREALDALGLEPEQVVAFEDSTAGIRSAKGAGIRCVAVSSTLDADLSQADLVVSSFEEAPLGHVLHTLGRAPSYAAATGTPR